MPETNTYKIFGSWLPMPYNKYINPDDGEVTEKTMKNLDASCTSVDLIISNNKNHLGRYGEPLNFYENLLSNCAGLSSVILTFNTMDGFIDGEQQKIIWNLRKIIR